MQSFINQQHTKDASPPPFFRDSNKLLVCLLRAVNVSFHICIKMLLSKLLGRTGDKVIHVISPPDLASVSEFLGKKKKQCYVKGASPCQVGPERRTSRWICERWGETVIEKEAERAERWGVWECTDLSLEEMRAPLTELTPQACHILFSAPLSKTGLRTKKGASTVTCFWQTR